ncbi:hypothetical protein YC2023_054265 [Brassica napus]
MAFGSGVRLCIVAEFSKFQMAIFLHHLVTYDDSSTRLSNYISNGALEFYPHHNSIMDG